MTGLPDSRCCASAYRDRIACPFKRHGDTGQETVVRNSDGTFYTTPMSFPRLLRKFSHPNLARSAANDTSGSGPPDDSIRPTQRRQTSKSIPTMPLWRKKKQSAEHFDPSMPTVTPPITSYAESPTSRNGGSVLALYKALPAIPNTSPANQTMVPSLEMLPAISPMSDMLAEAWDAVKDDSKVENTSRELDTLSVSRPSVARSLLYHKLTLASR